MVKEQKEELVKFDPGEIEKFASLDFQYVLHLIRKIDWTLDKYKIPNHNVEAFELFKIKYKNGVEQIKVCLVTKQKRVITLMTPITNSIKPLISVEDL